MTERAQGRPRMIRGSVVLQRRRCGTASCRCTDGESLHEATVLSYSQGGRNRTMMLSPEKIAPVRAAVGIRCGSGRARTTPAAQECFPSPWLSLWSPPWSCPWA